MTSVKLSRIASKAVIRAQKENKNPNMDASKSKFHHSGYTQVKFICMLIYAGLDFGSNFIVRIIETLNYILLMM